MSEEGRKSAASMYELSYTSNKTKRNRVVRIVAEHEDDIRAAFNKGFKIVSLDYIGTVWQRPQDALDAAHAEDRNFQ